MRNDKDSRDARVENADRSMPYEAENAAITTFSMEHDKFFLQFPRSAFKCHHLRWTKIGREQKKDYTQWNALKQRVSLIIAFNVLIDRAFSYLSHNWKIIDSTVVDIIDYGRVRRRLRFEWRLWNKRTRCDLFCERKLAAKDIWEASASFFLAKNSKESSRQNTKVFLRYERSLSLTL